MIEYQDNTIRDGMQQQGLYKNLRTKIKVVDLIRSAKEIKSVEVGMCTCEEERRMLASVIRHLGRHQSPVVLTRLSEDDIMTTAKLHEERSGLIIKLLVPISKLHIEEKLRMNESMLAEKFEKSMQLVVEKGIRLDICFEDATRADEALLFRMLELCARYNARCVTIADTVGCSTPDEYGHLIKRITKSRPPYMVATHTHNDMGLATANAYAGVVNGARQVETSFLGVGERAGNAPIDEIAYLVNKKLQADEFSYDGLAEIVDISKKIQEIIGFRISDTKPLIGKNVFYHEAGIHQAGCLKHREMYQYVLPEELGEFEALRFGISGLSSSKVIHKKINEIVGNAADAAEITKLYKKLSKTLRNISVEEACDFYYTEKGAML